MFGGIKTSASLTSASLTGGTAKEQVKFYACLLTETYLIRLLQLSWHFDSPASASRVLGSHTATSPGSVRFLSTNAALHMWRPEDTSGDWFSLSTVWAPGIELRSSGLLASALAPQALCFPLRGNSDSEKCPGRFLCSFLYFPWTLPPYLYLPRVSSC